MRITAMYSSQSAPVGAHNFSNVLPAVFTFFFTFFLFILPPCIRGEPLLMDREAA